MPGANATLDYIKSQLGKPLAGAYIILNQLASPVVSQPGHLEPGMVYATSDSQGYYLMVAPSLLDIYILVATHPAFQEREPADVFGLAQLNLAGSVFQDFYFEKPVLSQTPANVSIANSPEQPAPGQLCQIQISASQGFPASPGIDVTLASVGTNNLLTGLVETNAHGFLSNKVVVATGPNSSLLTATVSVDKPVRLILNFSVQGQNSDASVGPTPFPIDFAGPTLPTPSPIPKPDTNDVHGPLVVATSPPDHGFVDESDEITVFFNKPIDTSVTNNQGIQLTLDGAAAGIDPVVSLSVDQQVLTLRYPGLQPSAEYTLTLSGPGIHDLANQPLDQRPDTLPADSFTTTFRTPDQVVSQLKGITSGKGAIISGTRLYLIDQAAQANYLDVYDISVPTNAVRLSQTELFGQPRDLCLIPHYHYSLNAHQPYYTNDIVAVVGGDLTEQQSSDLTITVRGQYLTVFAMGDGTAPQTLASPIVSFRIGSAVTKVRWAPPFLVYEEFGADIQLLGLVNLQEMIIGFNASAVQKSEFIPGGKNGLDLNGDGDYTDPNETMPLPDSHPAEFYGKHQNYIIQNSNQKILDFAVTPQAGIVGVVLKGGLELGFNGQPDGVTLLPMYRTLVFNGTPLNIAKTTDAAVSFGTGAYPRWVTILDSQPVISNGVPLILPLAIVSLEPDTNGLQTLAVIDITIPEKPQLLNRIPIPAALLGGDIMSVNRRPDGLLEVAGTLNRVLVDPVKLLSPNPPDGQVNAAVVGLDNASGSTVRTYGSTDYGVSAVSDGGRNRDRADGPHFSVCELPRQWRGSRPAQCPGG